MPEQIGQPRGNELVWCVLNRGGFGSEDSQAVSQGSPNRLPDSLFGGWMENLFGGKTGSVFKTSISIRQCMPWRTFSSA